MRLKFEWTNPTSSIPGQDSYQEATQTQGLFSSPIGRVGTWYRFMAQERFKERIVDSRLWLARFVSGFSFKLTHICSKIGVKLSDWPSQFLHGWLENFQNSARWKFFFTVKHGTHKMIWFGEDLHKLSIYWGGTNFSCLKTWPMARFDQLFSRLRGGPVNVRVCFLAEYSNWSTRLIGLVLENRIDQDHWLGRSSGDRFCNHSQCQYRVQYLKHPMGGYQKPVCWLLWRAAPFVCKDQMMDLFQPEVFSTTVWHQGQSLTMAQNLILFKLLSMMVSGQLCSQQPVFFTNLCFMKHIHNITRPTTVVAVFARWG